MEEVVGAFVNTRPAVLRLAQQPTSPVLQRGDSPKRRLANDSTEETREPKRLRSSARLSASKGAYATAEMARQEADIFSPEQRESSFDDGLVACPICLMRMKETQVDKHLDTNCPGSPQPESQRAPASRDQSISMNGYQSITKQPTTMKRPDRLPAINYSSFKEQPLRKKLAELGISTLGDRKMLERRHREWMTIWNANCDALLPRKKTELLQDLNTWENTLGSRAPTVSRSINLGAQIKDKDFNQQAWSTQHDASFRDLIANARKNVAKAKQNAIAENSQPVAQELLESPLVEGVHPAPHHTQNEVVGGLPGNPIIIDSRGLPERTAVAGAEKGASDPGLVESSSTLDRIAGQFS